LLPQHADQENDMKKLILIALFTMVSVATIGQDYNAMATKIQTIVNADAEFINVRNSVYNKMKGPTGKDVQVAKGLVTFDKAEVYTFSPGLSKADEWLYSISFASSPKAKRDFFMLTKSINTLLMKDGYSLRKQGANDMIYSHASKPLVTLSLVSENGQSNVECMVIQNERYFKNPKNKNNYFNHLGKTSSTVRMSTALGNFQVQWTLLQYYLSFQDS